VQLAAKVKNWLIRRKLGDASRAVLADHLTYLSPEKLQRIEAALARIDRDRIAGDILEFGVALGGSGILLAGHARNGRNFHGFDVFDMIPPPTSDKDDDKSRERYEAIKSGRSQGIHGDEYYGYRDNLFETVKDSFARHGRPVDGVSVQLHKGLFEETWPKIEIGPVAFAHVDCDWYEPVRYCLHVVADRLSIGGAMVIDDYHDYGGAHAAVDEFLLARPGFAFDDGANAILRRLAA